MSKFRKKGKKSQPAVNTASLPDIVFMLLFFFMVTTVMRETSLKVENNITRLDSDNLFQCNITISNIGAIDAHNVDLSLLQIGRIPDLHDSSHIILNNLSTFGLLRLA